MVYLEGLECKDPSSKAASAFRMLPLSPSAPPRDETGDARAAGPSFDAPAPALRALPRLSTPPLAIGLSMPLDVLELMEALSDGRRPSPCDVVEALVPVFGSASGGPFPLS